MVELSSTTLSGFMMRCAGFWFPRATGYDNLEAGKKLGAVRCFLIVPGTPHVLHKL
jgi:hypothetical protein